MTDPEERAQLLEQAGHILAEAAIAELQQAGDRATAQAIVAGCRLMVGPDGFCLKTDDGRIVATIALDQMAMLVALLRVEAGDPVPGARRAHLN